MSCNSLDRWAEVEVMCGVPGECIAVFLSGLQSAAVGGVLLFSVFIIHAKAWRGVVSHPPYIFVL